MANVINVKRSYAENKIVTELSSFFSLIFGDYDKRKQKKIVYILWHTQHFNRKKIVFFFIYFFFFIFHWKFVANWGRKSKLGQFFAVILTKTICQFILFVTESVGCPEYPFVLIGWAMLILNADFDLFSIYHRSKSLNCVANRTNSPHNWDFFFRTKHHPEIGDPMTCRTSFIHY